MEIIVHGGAGGLPDEPEPRQGVLDEAAAQGVASDDPLDAVEAAVKVLEASPRFNAGIGGSIQSDGRIRTDAGIMRSNRVTGAVCSTPGLGHAVSGARVVAEETPHVLVSGENALELSEAFGVETELNLSTERTRERWAELQPPDGGPEQELAWLREHFGGSDGAPKGDVSPVEFDTVGAVARQGDRFATATSTGGRWLAFRGRVGDVPQVGSGFYASPAGAASATGAGEDIARVTLCSRAVRHLEEGTDASTAASRAMEEFEDITGSTAGIIVAGPDGTGSAFNSEGMQTAHHHE